MANFIIKTDTSDPSKIPDILDFFVYSGIADNLLDIEDSGDLNPDHTPIVLSYSSNVPTITRNNKIITHKTNISMKKSKNHSH